MDRAILQYLIGGRNLWRVNLGRSTSEAALKKAREFLREDVRISTRRGRVLSPEEFDQLD